VHVATRFGALVGDDGKIALDGRPEYVRRAAEASLLRLRVEAISLLAYTRLDPRVPIEETVGAMGDLVREGKVRFLGLSEMAPEIIRRAHAVHPLTSVESEYSLWMRVAHDQLATCRELGIGFLAYSPLGRGMLTGLLTRDATTHARDFRRTHPMFQGESFDRNRALVTELERLAAAKATTASKLALAWVLAQGEDIVPIPGTRRAASVTDNVDAMNLTLDVEELATLSEIFAPGKVAGTRHSAALRPSP
jgi:aryl-alcohol dehydrogenase-like predicted oxidoreductase